MSKAHRTKGETKKQRPKSRGRRPNKADIAAAAQVAALYADGNVPAPEQLAQLTVPAQIGYSDELMEAIMAQVAQGNGIKEIAQRKGMPDHVSIYRWLDASEKWQARYRIATQQRARSRVEQAEQQADRMLLDDDPKRVLLYDARVRTLTRLAALGDPMRYSEKMLHLHHHTGELAVKLEFDLGQKVGNDKQPSQDIQDISEV